MTTSDNLTVIVMSMLTIPGDYRKLKAVTFDSAKKIRGSFIICPYFDRCFNFQQIFIIA